MQVGGQDYRHDTGVPYPSGNRSGGRVAKEYTTAKERNSELGLLIDTSSATLYKFWEEE
jgi:hypothetical protein